MAENLEELGTDANSQYYKEDHVESNMNEGFEHDNQLEQIRQEELRLQQEEVLARQETIKSHQRSNAVESHTQSKYSSSRMEQHEMEPRVQFKGDARNQVTDNDGFKIN